MTARIVDVQYHTLLEGLPAVGEPDNHQWMAVLQVGGGVRDLPPRVPLAHRAGAGGRAADPASRSTRGRSASASASCSPRCARSAARAPGTYANEAERLTGKLHETPQVRPHRGHLRTRPAPVPRRRRRRPAARSASTSRARTSTTRWWHESRTACCTSPSSTTTARSPRATTRSACGRYDDEHAELRRLPAAHAARRRRPTASRDYFGNWVHRFNVMPKHRRLRVEAESVVMTQEPPSTCGRSETLVGAGPPARGAARRALRLPRALDVRAASADELAPLRAGRRGRQRRTARAASRAPRRRSSTTTSATRRARRTCTRRSSTCSRPAPACARTSPTC